MEEKLNSPTKEAEHIGLAKQMAREILERFDAQMQNEMISCIRTNIMQSREDKISTLQKEMEYLKTHNDSL